MQKLCAFILLVLGISGAIGAVDTVPKIGGTSLILNFTSVAIAKGKLNDWANRNLTVYLPASYALEASRRYPVVYTFHGFGDSASVLINAIVPLLESSSKGPDFIIVAVDGSSRRGGSFYVNSANTGDFEDMVTQEVLPLVDRSLRTIPTASGRLLAGFSMGGFAAWNLALAHADLFAGAWACCPGAFDANGLKDAMALWDYGFRSAYGAAFAWNARNPAKGPVFDGSPADNALIKLWEAGFGDIQGKLANYRKKGVALREVRFDYGTKDAYDWIPRGTVATAQAMAAAGIKTSTAGYPASHEIYAPMLIEGFFPLVARLFAPSAAVPPGAPLAPLPESKVVIADARNQTVYFESAAVARGSLKESPFRHFEVHLPASYASAAGKRYPVVYTFHGFNSPVAELGAALQTAVAAAEAGPAVPEFIIVAIDGSNKRIGSFYVDSPITGDFETMVVGEIIPLVDASFRTIPATAARIAAGFSLGGFAAWNLALAHADIFGAAWACCPGAFDTNGLRDAIPTWDSSVRNAYGSAFAPGAAKPGKPPVFDGSPADTALVRLWESGYGDFSGKIARYKTRAFALSEIRFDYGTEDSYAWIPRGTLALAASLRAAGIPTGIAGYKTDHLIAPGMVAEGLVPLIQRAFAKIQPNPGQ